MNNDGEKKNLNVCSTATTTIATTTVTITTSTSPTTITPINNNTSSLVDKKAAEAIQQNQQKQKQSKQQQQQKTAATAKHTQKSAATAARSAKQAAKAQKQTANCNSNNNNINNNNNNSNQSAALNLATTIAATTAISSTTNVATTTSTTANIAQCTRTTTPTPPPPATHSAIANNNNSINSNTVSGKRSVGSNKTTMQQPAEHAANGNIATESIAASGSGRKARVRVKIGSNSNNNTTSTTSSNSSNNVPSKATATASLSSNSNSKKHKNEFLLFNTSSSEEDAMTTATGTTTSPQQNEIKSTTIRKPGLTALLSTTSTPSNEYEPALTKSNRRWLPLPGADDPIPAYETKNHPYPALTEALDKAVKDRSYGKMAFQNKCSSDAATSTAAGNPMTSTQESETKSTIIREPSLTASVYAQNVAGSLTTSSSSIKDSETPASAKSRKLLYNFASTNITQRSAVAAAAAIKQQLKNVAAASSSGTTNSARSSTSSNSSAGIVNAISSALQTIITSDTSDTDTEVFPPRATDLSESDEESVSEILLACLCLRPDLLDDIPESDPESCGQEEVDEANEDEDDGDDEDEDEEIEDEEDDEEDDEDDEENEEEEEDEDEEDEDEDEEIDEDDENENEEIPDPNEVTGNFLLDSSTDRNRNLTALFEAAAHDKAPVLRHATHAIDETKLALTKMRGTNSPRDKTIFSRTLIAACNDNDVNTVRRLLGKGNVNINESTDDGESLLSMACSAGYYELAQVLLAMSAAQVEDKGQKDCTPLMEAASAGHLDIVKLLINHNADVNAHCATGNTPLMFACAGGHVDVVKELLKHGANVEEQNENGHTPLMEAASAGHVEVAKVLLEHGAGINTHSNEFKESALTLACYKGHLNMVRFLLQAGADQEHKTDEMHTALMEASMDGHVEVARLLLDSGAQVNMPTDSFESPLTLAACGGHVELATLLIERGANIEEVNDEGYTPLMEAAREGHEEMVALLLSKGANINATTEETQETALTLACCGGFSEVAEFLIKEGANLELGASTPLMEAAQEGHTDLVRFLLENKANVHAETQTGDTALTHACENGHTDAAEVLLSYGAELEHESEGGRTPLMKACRAGHLCTVKFLIQKGADVNKQTSSNDHTPLSLACAGGHQAVVELLLKSGADPFHKLKDNSTMLIEAAKGGHTRVVELLFKYPHFIQNHQNEMQSAAAAAAAAAAATAATNAAAAAAVGINNSVADQNTNANQMRLINMQHQKQLQQSLQQQLQNLSAPPGLHEVSDAVRASNQQIFHQQQFNGNVGNNNNLPVATNAATAVNQVSGGVGEYLDEQLQMATAVANAAAKGDEFAAIDINSLSAQQQEALIAKSRLFHLQAGYEPGINQQQHPSAVGGPMQTLQPSIPRKHFDLDMAHINSLTPPQKPPPAPPIMQQDGTTNNNMPQQQMHPQTQPKLKGSQRKSRQQPPAPFELNLSASNTTLVGSTQLAQPDEVRSQPVGDEGIGTAVGGDNHNHNDAQNGDLMEEFSKNLELFRGLRLANQPTGEEGLPSIDGQQQQQIPNVVNNVTPNNMNSINSNTQYAGNKANNSARLTATRSNKNLQSQQQQKGNSITGNANERGCSQIITPSEVSQSTAISDRPKAKAVSKKDSKNFRKTTAFTQLPMLQQNQMVSIYNNNMPVLITNDNKQQQQDQQAIVNQMIYVPQQPQVQQQQQLQLPTGSHDVTNSAGVVGGVVAGGGGIIDYSNSPASPLASPPNSNSPGTMYPSTAYIMQQQQQQQAIILSEILQQQQQLAATNAMAQGTSTTQGPTNNSNADFLNTVQGSQDGNVGVGLEESCCTTSSTSLVDDNRAINVHNGSGNSGEGRMPFTPAAVCNMSKLDIKMLQESWHLFGVRRFFEQPKSPTETPPENQTLASYNDVMVTTQSSDAPNSEAKSLSALCAAAAAAASSASGNSEVDINKPKIDNVDGEDGSPVGDESHKKYQPDQQESSSLVTEGEHENDNVDAHGNSEENGAENQLKEMQTHEAKNQNCSEVGEQILGMEEKEHSTEQQHETPGENYDDIDLPSEQKDEDIEEINRQYDMDGGCGDAPMKARKISKQVDFAQLMTDFNRRMDTPEDMMYMFPSMYEYLKQTTLADSATGENTDNAEKEHSADDQVITLTEQFYINQQNQQDDAYGAAVSDNSSASSGEASVGGELYPVPDEPLEQYDEVEREPMYDLAVDHLDEIFQVIHNVNDPAIQELTSNLNCTELADFGINSMCKARWNDKWPQAKWVNQNPLFVPQQQPPIIPGDDQQQQQQQQDQGGVLCDRSAELRVQRDIQMLQHMERRKQRAALSLLPYVSEGSEAALAIQQILQQQQHPLSTTFQYHLQQQQQTSEAQPLAAMTPGDPAGLKQHIQQLQHLHLHQQENARLLKAMSTSTTSENNVTQQQQPQNNYVFNIDGNNASVLSHEPSTTASVAGASAAGGDDKSTHLQLLFELPQGATAVQQQQQLQQEPDEAQQLQNLQLLNQELLDQRKQHEERVKLLQQQQQQILHDLSQETAKRLLQQQQHSQQLEQIALLQQQKAAALSHQVLNQQVSKQKQLIQHQQMLIHQQQQQHQQQHLQQHQQQQQQACAQHTQQVQVATQTQSSVVVPHTNVINRGTPGPQYCPTMPVPSDISNGLGVCTVASAQQQQQHQQVQQQQQQQQLVNVSTAQLPAPPLTTTTATTTKMPSGIAKKAIDKQARKDRNRYSLLRQTPAGGQVNAAAQQHYQQAVATPNTTVDKTIDVDSETDSNHDTALTLACAGGHEELVELLITRGANIEHRDKKGFTPLILAATAGHEKVVDILLKRGAQLEAQSERTKDTPLSLACSGGRYEVVELLLSLGANKEHRNVSDYTPLSLAASGGYVNIIKLLLSHGAEINSRTGSKLGISPLMLAAMNGHTAAVKLLLDQGSDINAQIETNRNTALTLACFQGRHEVVSLLLDRKANVEHRAKTGLTPLMEAASGGYIEVGRVLLDKGADVNAAPVPTSRDTALTIAADKGHLKFVELLLSRNAIVEVKNKKGNSPLWLAAHGGHLSVVEVLYAHNADIDSQDNRRVSCLMAAFRKGHTKVVKWMVQYVTQFPSDQEMTRFISTISDKELADKCDDCKKIIHAAKVAQEVKAFQNASRLLDELDMERSREESRRAAAARRRERKKKKKMEKKEEKRRQMEGADGGSNTVNDDENDNDDKDSDKDIDSDKEDAVAGDDDNVHGQNYREEGDSGIDQGSCSSSDVKASNSASQQETEKTTRANKNKNKKKKAAQQQQVAEKSHSPDNHEDTALKVTNAKQAKQQSTVDQALTASGKTGPTNKKIQNNNEASTTKNIQATSATQKKLTPSEALNNHNKRDEVTNVVPSNAATASKKKESSSNKQREKENHVPKGTDNSLASTTTATTQHNNVVKQQPYAEKSKHEKFQDSSNNRKAGTPNNHRDENKLRHDDSFPTTASARDSSNYHSHHQQQHQSSTTCSNKPCPPKRGEDGWKEVVRKSSTQQQNATTGATASSALSISTSSTTNATSTATATSASSEMTCKKVQVPVNAISRVIGRAGSNINAIRAATGAHIEVEKQGKNQSERSITIKGLTDATKQAHMLILALIKDPDVDILQMLSRIHSSSSKPTTTSTASLPMTVGTWDNKTAVQTSISTSSCSSSASSTPASAAQNTSHSTTSLTFTSSNTSVGTNKSNAFNISNSSSVSSTSVGGKHSSNSNTTSKSQLSSAGTAVSGSSKSSTSSGGRSQPTKPYYSQQQQSTRSGASGSNSNVPASQQKQHKSHHQETAKHASNSYVSALTSTQKNLNTKQQQASSHASAHGNNSNGQTSFAAKLTGSTSAGHLNATANHHHPSPSKKSEGRLSSNTTIPYGRGKPIASLMSTNLGPSLGGGSNTLSGPIGTFNVAEVAAINAAAAAAQAAAAQAAAAAAATAASSAATSSVITSTTANSTTTRSVTPIGPPSKRNLASPSISATVANQHQQSMLQQQQLQSTSTRTSQPKIQSLLSSSATLNDEVVTAAALEMACINKANAAATVSGASTGFGPQLASKISSGYSLFDGSYQSQWCEKSQMYRQSPCDLVNDLPPKADASKAPGYNRNVLSSPVGGSSKTSSSNSTSPPGTSSLPAPIGSQQQAGSQQKSASNSGLTALTVNTSVGAPIARSPGQMSATGSDSSATLVAKSSNMNSSVSSQPVTPKVSISPGVIKPPAPIGQPTSTATASSGLAIQRPPSSQHRGTSGGNSGTGAGQHDRQTPTMNFGLMGMNTARTNGPGAIGEQNSINRYYEQSNLAAQNSNTPHHFPMDPAVQTAMHNSYGGSVGNNSAVHPLTSRLNPRASAFSQGGTNANNNGSGNKILPQPPQPIGSGMYGQQQNNAGFNSVKPFNTGSGLAPGRPQSQPQQGTGNNQTQHRWYGGNEYGGGGVGFGGGPPNARDLLTIDNGMVMGIGGGAASGNSPAAMSPNQSGGGGAHTDDARKMPRPIGTERATWKCGSYPNANMNAPGIGGIDEGLAAVMSTAGAMANASGSVQQLPPWMMDKSNTTAAVGVQQQQQQPNWIKQQQAAAAAAAAAAASSSAYRYYGNAAGGLTGLGPADYHHPEAQFYQQMGVDYHANMIPPTLNQSQPVNLIPNYQYPNFVVPGNEMVPGVHMPDKVELWGEHHDKYGWWTN